MFPKPDEIPAHSRLILLITERTLENLVNHESAFLLGHFSFSDLDKVRGEAARQWIETCVTRDTTENVTI